jgi:NADPH:quinone reductase
VANNCSKEQIMRAIRVEAFGDPSVLEAVEVPTPIGDEKTAVVRVMAASINPSDVKNVAGAMRQTTPPRIPARDFAGVVEVGPSEWIGAEVWGTGGAILALPATEPTLSSSPCRS